IQFDFNLNTPIHLCAQFNSLAVLAALFAPDHSNSQLLVEQTVFLFNEDGLNPFLLATRHSDVNLVRFLLETYRSMISFGLGIVLLSSLDLVNYKNCLHYALSQDSRNSHAIVCYLINLAVTCTTNVNKKQLLSGLVSSV